MKKRKRVLSSVLVLAMFLALVSLCASATYALDVRLYVYENSAEYAYLNNGFGATLDEVIGNSYGHYFDMNDDTDGYWLYTYNGEFGKVGKYQPVVDEDVLAVYLVPTASYSTATFAKIDDTTAIIRNGELIAKTGLALKGEVQNFDMSKPYVRDASLTFEDFDDYLNPVTTTVTDYMTAVRISGTGVLPTVIPVNVVSSYAAYATEINAMLAKLTETAYKENNQDWIDDAEDAAELVDVDEKADAVIALGQLIYAATRSTDKRLATADFGEFLCPTVPVDPDIYAYTLDASNGTGVFTGSTVSPVFTTIDPNMTIDVDANNSAQESNGTWTLQDGATTFTVAIDDDPEDQDPAMTYTFTLVKTPQSGGSSIFNSVGYLPVGQFASGASWGCFYSGDENITNANGSIKKFSTVSCTAEPGVSLGAAGGYIEFNCTTPIANSSATPYGVDFIVYGNAFNGNPEAAAVKVYGTEDGISYDWYQLAGSHYYDGVSLNNVDVSYKKQNGGIYYRVEKNNVPLIGWTQFKDTTSWWPDYDPVNGPGNLQYKNYGRVWGSVNDVIWNSPYDEITYKNVCLVIDTDYTNDYQFGYADVHINGSMSATPVNPYSIANTGSGGDGFDLSWAVNGSGEPVALLEVSKIRVYTSACLNSAGTAFTVPGAVGETSAEVCGIFLVSDTPEDSVYIPSCIEIDDDPYDLSDFELVDDNGYHEVYTYDYGVSIGTLVEITAASTANVFINGERTTSFEAVNDNPIQIIVQNGDAEPLIIVLT